MGLKQFWLILLDGFVERGQGCCINFLPFVLVLLVLALSLSVEVQVLNTVRIHLTITPLSEMTGFQKQNHCGG